MSSKNEKTEIHITLSLRYSYALFPLFPMFSFFCVFGIYMYIYLFVCTSFYVDVKCAYGCMSVPMHVEPKGTNQCLKEDNGKVLL